jgi:soluble lytic murein transglycosylase-like protein
VTPDEHTEAERERSEARGAELRSELAATDARRAEEDTAEAQREAKEAQERAEKLSRKEQEAHEKAEQAQRIAQREREEAELAERREREASGRPFTPAPGPASVEPTASDRPEILVGAAFAGAFIFARILKRLVD